MLDLRIDDRPGVVATKSRPFARIAVLLSAGMLASAALPVARASFLGPQTASHDYENISPGAPASLREVMPVNHVFVGYGSDDVDEQEYLTSLPEASEPLERMPLSLYDDEKPLGITHTFAHRLTFTGEEYEDRFFEALEDLATASPLTEMQTNYNGQATRTATIENNHVIKGPAVERWLADNPPSGVDTRDHTVFFINWYGREDFRFHVYEKTGEPESDFGDDEYGGRENDLGIAWGGSSADDPETGLGSTHRIWFHDLSAGPEERTANWDVTNPDLNGDGQEEYRMPPVWEYAKGGFRSPGDLTADLAKIARYVAIDLLFAPSPLYTPAIASPRMARSVNLDINFYDTSPEDTSEAFIREEEIRRAISVLLPDRDLSVDKQDLDVHDPDHARCFASFWNLSPGGQHCYTPENPSYVKMASLYLYGVKNLGQIFHDGPEVDHEAGSFNYWLPSLPNPLQGCFGMADHNYSDGSQGFVYVFLHAQCTNPYYKHVRDLLACRRCSARWGYTDFLIHEYGHHFGLSHPHDGYDWETGRDFSPTNDYFFAWVGDESNSVMSYAGYNNDFSQFDLDNMTRWMTAAYLTATNEIALLEFPASEDAALQQADDLVGAAAASFAARRYQEALDHATRAHGFMVAAAKRAGLAIPESWTGHTLVDESASIPDVGSVRQRPGAYMYVDDLREMGTERMSFPRLESRSNL